MRDNRERVDHQVQRLVRPSAVRDIRRKTRKQYSAEEKIRIVVSGLRGDLKNRVLLENYYLPGDLEASVGIFVEHYNHRRYHESLANLTPADVYFGRDHAIIERRRKIKNLTIKKRRLAGRCGIRLPRRSRNSVRIDVDRHNAVRITAGP